MAGSGRVANPSLLLRVAPLAGFLVGWECLSRLMERGAFFIASPTIVFSTFLGGLRSGVLLWDTLVTGAEALLGFIVGNLLGTAVGLALWYYPKASDVARPYVIVLGSLPVFALAPILIIWLGIGFVAKAAIAAMSTVFVALAQAHAGAENADQDSIRLLLSMGATRRQVFQKVIIPSAVAWVVVGYRVNVGFALLGAFLGEFIASDSGLGHMVMISMGVYDVAGILTAVLCFGILALVLTAALRPVQKWFETRRV